jgi:sporulation protein YlmC with PRC-barrel domain
MTEEFRQRADLLGTQVITRTTGKRLGVVSQLWVDIDDQRVIALSLRPNLFYGTPQPMLLESIRQVGDVILVEDENVIDDIDTDRYSNLMNCEVITETGDLLGKVRGFRFNIDSGKLDSITIAAIGIPLIPDQIVSTYELPIDEIVSSGPDRLIVYEGAEERLAQLTVGVLERLGIGRAPWEREDDQSYIAPVRIENQLSSGQPLQAPIQQQRRPMVEETWDEDNWEETEPMQMRQPLPQQRAQAYYEEDDEAGNWNDADHDDDYDDDNYDADNEADVKDVEVIVALPAEPEAKTAYEELADEDVWGIDQPEEPYVLPELNLPEKMPEKTKMPEYEE